MAWVEATVIPLAITCLEPVPSPSLSSERLPPFMFKVMELPAVTAPRERVPRPVLLITMFPTEPTRVIWPRAAVMPGLMTLMVIALGRVTRPLRVRFVPVDEVLSNLNSPEKAASKVTALPTVRLVLVRRVRLLLPDMVRVPVPIGPALTPPKTPVLKTLPTLKRRLPFCMMTPPEKVLAALNCSSPAPVLIMLAAPVITLAMFRVGSSGAMFTPLAITGAMSKVWLPVLRATVPVVG